MNRGVAGREGVIKEFVGAVDGYLDEELVEQLVTEWQSLPTASAAEGDISSHVFHQTFSLCLDQGPLFTGQGGGVCSPGDAALFGNLYSKDLPQLYAATASFFFLSKPGYFSMVFFSGDTRVLGCFLGEGLDGVMGAGGGKGSWSELD